MSESALQTNVLVLNKLYMPTSVVNVKDCISLLFREAAEVVHVDESHFYNFSLDEWLEAGPVLGKDPCVDDPSGHDPEYVRSQRVDFRVPKVIRLYSYDQMPRRVVKFSRRAIFQRDGFKCAYCGKRFSQTHLSLDHVRPRRDGGPATWDNLVTACVHCNTKKGARTPEDASMQLRFKPKRPLVSPVILADIQRPKYSIWSRFIPTHAK
ncbi:MAG: HNH endonuclease [Planctomycetes bacterium]|nr:HNH endonuclease [Planctomycetota bacterium]